MIRSALLRLGSVVLGALLALLLGEVGLRLLDVGPGAMLTKRTLTRVEGPPAEYHCYSSDPTGDFVPAPDVETGRWRLSTMMFPPRPIALARIRETPHCVEYRSSKQQMRDRLYPQRPRDDVVRILGIGDSFAYGEGVPLRKSLFKQIERLLGPRYEVVNAAVRGFDTSAELAQLERIAPLLDATRALVVFVPNDVRIPDALRDRERYINDLILIRDEYLEARQRAAWYGGGLRVLELVGSFWELRRISRETIEWYRSMYDPSTNPGGLEQLRRDFEQLARVPGCRAALVLYPLMVGFDRYPLADVHRRVAAMAQETGLPVLDLAGAFRGHDAESLRVHPTDHHPNGAAHAIAAEAIVDWLRRDVPGFLPAS